VLIDSDRRHRRRILLETEGSRHVLTDLPQAARLRNGDGLALEGGGIVRVCARAEKLLEIHAHEEASSCASPGISATATCPCSFRATASGSVRTM
jgi:urease accessory protein UreE